MANIAAELAAIMAAVYGEEVRGSIHDAIDKINTASEKAISSGTAFGPGDLATGYPSGSLYLNTDPNTMVLLRSNGTTWQDAGNIRGDNGIGIDHIAKTGTVGLVDTYTVYYDDDLTTDTFDVTNGENGNRWYTGVAVSGKSTTPAVFPGTGITKAFVNDFYVNVSEGAVYHCVLEGAANVAKWVYDFTMAGGGGASAWGDLQGKPFTTLDDGLTVTSISGHPETDGILKVKLNTDTHKFDTNDAITLSDDVTDILDALDPTGEEADLFLSTDGSGGLKWVEAPNGTKRYLIGTLPAGKNMLGEWQEGPESSWRKKDDDDKDTFAFDAAFYEDASKHECISLHFMFDSKTNQPIYIAGFQWWNDESTQKGGVNCMLANTPDSPVDIWVEVMRTVEN